MSLKIASVPELRTEMHEVLEGFGCAGLPATEVVSSGEGGWSLARIHTGILEGSLDVGLVPSGLSANGLEAVAVLEREEPRDVLVSRTDGSGTLARLQAGTRVGLVGARRLGLLRAHRPDLHAHSLTNGHTPVSMLESGAVDVLILGAAQSRQMGLSELTTEFLDPKAWVPGPGQGARVLVARAGDETTRRAASSLDDVQSRRAWECELALARALGAGTDAPLGALALPFGRWLRLWAMATSLDGSRMVRADLTGSAEDPEALGRAVADLLLMREGGTILAGGTP